MVTDKDLLNDICQNADMGRYSLQKVLERTDDARMRRSMRTQLSEYQDTYNQAKRMLYERGEQPHMASKAAKTMSHMMSTAKTLRSNDPSKIAQMVIQGSTMGVIKLTQRLNQYDGNDPQIQQLANRQLKTEQNNIEHMKGFL